MKTRMMKLAEDNPDILIPWRMNGGTNARKEEVTLMLTKVGITAINHSMKITENVQGGASALVVWLEITTTWCHDCWITTLVSGCHIGSMLQLEVIAFSYNNMVDNDGDGLVMKTPGAIQMVTVSLTIRRLSCLATEYQDSMATVSTYRWPRLTKIIPNNG